MAIYGEIEGGPEGMFVVFWKPPNKCTPTMPTAKTPELDALYRDKLARRATDRARAVFERANGSMAERAERNAAHARQVLLLSLRQLLRGYAGPGSAAVRAALTAGLTKLGLDGALAIALQHLARVGSHLLPGNGAKGVTAPYLLSQSSGLMPRRRKRGRPRIALQRASGRRKMGKRRFVLRAERRPCWRRAQRRTGWLQWRNAAGRYPVRKVRRSLPSNVVGAGGTRYRSAGCSGHRPHKR